MSDTAGPAGSQTEDVADEHLVQMDGRDAVTAVEAAKASMGADGLAPTGSVSPGAVQPDLETSGVAQDLGDIQLTVTARATKTCARLLWLEGQRRTFRHTDLDPYQLAELDRDPDFELDFHPA